MTDNNNNEPDGDLFGTHAAWEVPSSEVVRDWPSESEAAQIVQGGALNTEVQARGVLETSATYGEFVVDGSSFQIVSPDNAALPTGDGEEHSGVRAGVPMPGVEFTPHPDQTSPASVSYEQFAEASDFVQTDEGDHAAMRSGVPIPQDYEEGAALLNAATQDFAAGGDVVVDDHVAVEESDDAKQRRIADEVQTWLEAKEKSVAAVDTEREARKTVSATLFPNPVKGTQRVPIGANGQQIKLVHGWNYTIGDKDKVSEQGVKIPIYDQVAELEAKIAALGSEGSLLAPRLIKWTPSLVETEYLRLVRDDATDVEVQAKELIDAMLTVSEATPQLTLEEPKTKK